MDEQERCWCGQDHTSEPTTVVWVEIVDLDQVTESLSRFLIANGNDDTVAITTL